MSIKNILTVPNNILISKAEKIQVIDQDVKKIIQELIETANAQTDPEAAGLAAPQIGYNKRVILFHFEFFPCFFQFSCLF